MSISRQHNECLSGNPSRVQTARPEEQPRKSVENSLILASEVWEHDGGSARLALATTFVGDKGMSQCVQRYVARESIFWKSEFKGS